MVKWLLLATFVAGCSPQSASYVNSPSSGASSSLEIPESLPAGNFVGRLTDPAGQKIDVPFEAVPMSGATCYWSRLLSICTGDGTQLAPSDRGPEGLNVRVELKAPGSSEYVYYVYGGDNGTSDYTVVKDGLVVEFGLINTNSGQVYSKYERAN